MNAKTWKRVLSWLGENLGQILAGVFVGASAEFTFSIISPPESIADQAIFAGSAAVIAFYTGLLLYYLKDIKRLTLKPPLKVYNNQSSSDLNTLSFVVGQPPKKAKLIEYSSATVHGIISNLIAVNTDIQLLLQHPRHAVSEEQGRRICAQIKAYSMEATDYPHLKIRCYRERAAIRGRKFDDSMIFLGWYRYEASQDQNQNWVEKVWGHNNPLVVSSSQAKDVYYPLSEWFDTVFNEYWDNGEPLATVCDECPELGELNIPQNWLEQVST